jgi:hypothetical protein
MALEISPNAWYLKTSGLEKTCDLLGRKFFFNSSAFFRERIRRLLEIDGLGLLPKSYILTLILRPWLID